MGPLSDELLALCGTEAASVQDLLDRLHRRIGGPVRALVVKEEAKALCPPVSAGDASSLPGAAAWLESLAGGGVASSPMAGGTALAVPIHVGGSLLGILELCMAEWRPAEGSADLRACAQIVGLLLARELERAHVGEMLAMFDAVAHPIFVKDRKFRWVLLNQAFCELVGWPREELLFRSDHDYFPAEQADFFRAKDVEMFESQRKVRIDEEPITDARGTTHLLATTKVPLFAPDGSVTHLVGIIHDITRLKEIEAELQRKNRELAVEVSERSAAVARLADLNKELEAFSYSVSHDLRAPLRSIDGFSRAVIEDYADRLDEQGRRYLDRIRANAAQMAQLIDDILSLARVSRSTFNPGPVQLADLAGGIVRGLREADPEREVEVVIDPALEARGDLRLLGIALENLLRNAWKFTARVERPRIEFGARREGDETIFFVKDNGAGFDMASADQIFRPFSRLHRSEDFPGTGIGLATVQRIVHLHGGRIWAESQPGQGATFSFTLPS